MLTFKGEFNLIPRYLSKKKGKKIDREHRPREFMTKDAKKERRDNQVCQSLVGLSCSLDLAYPGGSLSILDEAYFLTFHRHESKGEKEMKKKKKKKKRELKKAVLRILLNPLIVIESTFRSLLFPSRIEIELLSRGWYKFHGVPISLIHGLAVFSKAPPSFPLLSDFSPGISHF